MSGYASWEFEEGEELRPGRAVLKTIGGGSRYEVCLVWARRSENRRTASPAPPSAPSL